MKIIIDNKADQKDIEFIKNNLKRHNEKFTVPDNHKELAVFLKDEAGKIKGGITGGTYWDQIIGTDIYFHCKREWLHDQIE